MFVPWKGHKSPSLKCGPKVIGRDGRTAKAIRTLLGAIAMKLHKRFTLEIIEEAKTVGK